MVIKHFYKIKQTDIEIIMSRKNDQNKRNPVQSGKVTRQVEPHLVLGQIIFL